MERHDDYYVSTHRFEALNDGVFAIAMTLMVMGIEVPENTSITNSADMLKALSAMWPQFFNYLLSFAIIMSMWISNNGILRHIEKLSKPYTLISLGSLMFICLLPFSSSLMGDYSNNVVAEMVFHVNLLALGILNMMRFMHLKKRKEIMYEEYRGHINRDRFLHETAIYIIVPILALIAAPIIPGYSTMCYLLMPVLGSIHRRKKSISAS